MLDCQFRGDVGAEADADEMNGGVDVDQMEKLGEFRGQCSHADFGGGEGFARDGAAGEIGGYGGVAGHGEEVDAVAELVA